MPNHLGPVLVTLRDLVSIEFVSYIFFLLFIFGILFKLIGGIR